MYSLNKYFTTYIFNCLEDTNWLKYKYIFIYNWTIRILNLSSLFIYTPLLPLNYKSWSMVVNLEKNANALTQVFQVPNFSTFLLF